MPDLYEDYAQNHLMRISTGKTRSHKQQAFLENYRSALPDDKAAKILEIGPGLGEIAELLVSKLKYTGYSAIDIARDVVTLLDEKPEFKVVHVDDPSTHLEARPGQYDLIILLHVLEHVPRHLVMRFVRAIHAALRPGGELIVEVPNAANAFVGSAYAFGDFTHETAFTSVSLCEVLGSAGFADTRISPVRVPRVSIARQIQHLLQVCLNGLQAFFARAYWPSGAPLFSHLITARSRK